MQRIKRDKKGTGVSPVFFYYKNVKKSARHKTLPKWKQRCQAPLFPLLGKFGVGRGVCGIIKKILSVLE